METVLSVTTPKKERDLCVVDHSVFELARTACQVLTNAYARSSGGSVDWADVDDSHHFAKQAIAAYNGASKVATQPVHLTDWDCEILLEALTRLRAIKQEAFDKSQEFPPLFMKPEDFGLVNIDRLLLKLGQ